MRVIVDIEDGAMIYTKVPPYLSVARVFEMHAYCVWHGLPWGCDV